MDRLDELANFVRIVEEGSLVRAAARLRRSPPAVTRALASLEDRIGLRLIDRTTRRLAATEAGRALYDKARGLMADYEAATAGAPDAPVRGLLRVTAPVQFGRRHIAPIVGRFLDSQFMPIGAAERTATSTTEEIDIAAHRPAGRSDFVGASWAGAPAAVASPAHLKRRGQPPLLISRATRLCWGPCVATPNGRLPALAVGHRRGWPDGCASTTSRPGWRPRAAAAASRSFYPTR